MFRALAAEKAEKTPRRGGLNDLVGLEMDSEEIPLAAIHAQFDEMGQHRKVDNSHTRAMVKVTRTSHS
ncbi:hypothetical protein ATO13_04105 [Stappia sp. 22II-S9-Z10]|nr:hypothetical protein ATO13_04105 [Stappia sp. 22II-S9-Z10]